jgi:translation initiation factor IF-1
MASGCAAINGIQGVQRSPIQVRPVHDVVSLMPAIVPCTSARAHAGYNRVGMTSPPPANDAPIVEGTVVEALPHALFAVELSNGQRILARIAGTLQMRGSRINPGDRVTVQLSPYDFSRGRITKRQR